ncbi:ribosome biogenesis protein ytm1 [Balamuthia mandrillaris]
MDHHHEEGSGRPLAEAAQLLSSEEEPLPRGTTVRGVAATVHHGAEEQVDEQAEEEPSPPATKENAFAKMLHEAVASLNDQSAASAVPTSSLDTFQLSKAAAAHILRAVDVTSHRLKGQISSELKGNYEEFTDAMHHVASLNNETNALSARLNALTERVRQPQTGLHALLVSPLLKRQNIQQNITTTQVLLSILSILKQFQEELQQYKAALAARDYITTSQSLSTMDDLLTEVEQSMQSNTGAAIDAKILHVIKKRHDRRKERLRDALKQLLKQVVSIQLLRLEVQTKASITPNKQKTDKEDEDEDEDVTARDEAQLRIHDKDTKEAEKDNMGEPSISIKDIFLAMRFLPASTSDGSRKHTINDSESETKSSSETTPAYLLDQVMGELVEDLDRHLFSPLLPTLDDESTSDAGPAVRRSLRMKQRKPPSGLTGCSFAVKQPFLVQIADEREKGLLVLTCTQQPSSNSSKSGSGSKNSEQAQQTIYNAIEQILEQIAKILQFLHEQLFDSDQELTRRFGAVLWPSLRKTLISKALAPTIPPNTAHLADYERSLTKFTHSFEEQLRSFYIIPALDNEEEKEYEQKGSIGTLTFFVQNIDTHFALKKRRDLLHKARTLFLSQSHNTISAADYVPSTLQGTEKHISDLSIAEKQQLSKDRLGVLLASPIVEDQCEEADDFFFRFPSCQISETVVALMDTAHETLSEAARLICSAPNCAATLQQTAREIFDLYRVLVPAAHASSLENVPALSMIFHNDCMFIAHSLLTFEYPYRARLSTGKQKPVSFLDMVPMFQHLAQTFYSLQMHKQHTILLELVNEAKGLHDTHRYARMEVVETTFKRVNHHLSHISKVWKPIMPLHVFLQAFGGLLDTVLLALIEQLKMLKDISEDETHNLHYLFSTLFVHQSAFRLTSSERKALGQMENSRKRREHNKEEQAERAAAGGVRDYVLHWDKFVHLTNILEAKMVDIVEDWRKGKLPDFTAAEVMALIKALFSDSPLRRQQLTVLSQPVSSAYPAKDPLFG